MNGAMVTYVYAALVAALGVAGYAMKQSVPSLVSGLVVAALMALAGFLLSKGNKNGFLLAVVGMAGTMLMAMGRYAGSKSSGFFPMGLLGVLSLVALIALILMSSRTRRA